MLRIGPLRLVLVRPDPTGYGNIAMQTTMAFYLGQQLRARVFIVLDTPSPVSRGLYELTSDDVKVVSQRGVGAALLRTLWRLAAGAEHSRLLVETFFEHGIASWLRRSDRHSIAQLARQRTDGRRRQLSRHASYFGLDFRALYAAETARARLSTDMQRTAEATAARLGISPDARIVTIHVRESGFHSPDGDESSRRALRNARIESYFPALDELVAAGYTVIRIGDPTMTPIARPGIVDSATAPERTEAFELWSVFRSDFFIATDSGPYVLSWLSHTPCLMTNLTNPLPQYPLMPRDMYIVKHVVHREHGAVSLSEMVSAAFSQQLRSLLRDPASSPYTFVDNTAEEISEAVADMRAFVAETPPQTRDQEEFRRVALAAYADPSIVEGWRVKRGINPPFLGAGRVAPGFARRHLHLAAAGSGLSGRTTSSRAPQIAERALPNHDSG